MTNEFLPERCPLCSGPNACGRVAGAPECWCYSVSISKEALASLPEEARGQACLCRACATGRASPARIEALLKELHRNR